MAYTVTEIERKQKVVRVNHENVTHRVYECPVCGGGKVHIENSVFYGMCDRCSATMFDFEPLPHQMEYFLSSATYKLLIGGYGSGKTTISCFDDAYHALTVPNARILVTAPTLQQMRVAVLPELNKFIPPWFLKGGRAKGNPPVYEFLNGSEIHVYASDDEQKIRSINLTRFHIEEGSGVPKPVFDQLQARLRNAAAAVYDDNGRQIGDKFSGVISTNPEDAWIKDDFLLKSIRLHGSQSIDLSVYEPLMSTERVELYETFISASYDNIMLPRGTIERISAGKDERWKRKYLLSMLDAREGLVYPEIHNNFVEPFEIPRTWQRIGGYDPGISDPTATLIGAIDPKTNIIYIYFEYYVRDQAISYHGQKLSPHIIHYNWFRPISADPSVNKRSQETGQSYRAYFRQSTGIQLNPVNNDLLYGIDKVRDYLHLGRIKIFNNLLEFKRETSVYAFLQPSDRNFTNSNNKPIDRDNHLMDCLRYMIVPLPEDPNKFSTRYIQDEVWKSSGVYIGARDEEITPNRKHGGITYGYKV